MMGPGVRSLRERIIECSSAMLVVVIVMVVTAADGSRFSMTSRGEVRVVNAGHELALGCDFHMATFTLFNNPVIWFKGQRNEVTRVNMMGNIVDPFLSTGRFDVNLHVTSTHHSVTLIIKELSVEDSGNYTCEVRAPGSVILAAITYHIFVRAPVQELTLFHGDIGRNLLSTPASLPCTEDLPTPVSCVGVGGYPPPTIDVFLSGVNISELFLLRTRPQLDGERGLRLMVYRTERFTSRFTASAHDDDKEMTCVATVPGVAPTITSTRLEVHYAPIIVCERGHAHLGERNAHIKCDVRARPRVDFIFWTLDVNGTTVTEGKVVDEYWTLVMDRGAYKLETHLYVHVVTSDAYRTYSVCARNDVGVSTQQVDLVQKFPVASGTSRQSEIGSLDDHTNPLDTRLSRRGYAVRNAAHVMHPYRAVVMVIVCLWTMLIKHC